MNSWGLDLYYFFNHKRYSQSAAFAYSKIQRISQGSFYAGFSTYTQDYDIDFSTLPAAMLEHLPDTWADYHYRVSTHNYGLRLGYGYNWVFARNWNLAASISPVVGISDGWVNSQDRAIHFSMYNNAKLGLVWNHGLWFAGLRGTFDTAIVSDKGTLFMGSNISFTGSVGYRFNLW